jgi:hypothetical protein
MDDFAVDSDYHYLLDDPDFRRFIQNVRRRSEGSALELLRRFGLMHRRFQELPKDFAKMDTKQAKRFELDMIDDFETKGGEHGEELAGSYIQNFVKAANRWLEFCDIPAPRKIVAEGAEDSVRYENEVPPTPEQLKTILGQADFRARAAIGIVAFTGVRLEVLGKKTYHGLDGLKVKDLPEMVIKDDQVEFPIIPTLVIVRKPISKIHRKYTTFLCDEGCVYLRIYLEWRMRELHEKLTPESPIITAGIFHPQHRGKHVRTTNVSDFMRKPIRAARFNWRPMVFRRYTDVRLESAIADHLIEPDWRTYWMGHKGHIEFVYTYAKGLLEENIEKMREGYQKAAEKYLTTRTKKEEATEDRILATINRRILQWYGYTDEEIEKLGNLSQLTQEQMQDLIDKKSAQALGGLQKIVPMDEVKKWVIQGWLFVQVLPGNEAVIRRPSPLLSGLLALGVDHLNPNLALGETLRGGKIVGLQENQFADRTV